MIYLPEIFLLTSAILLPSVFAISSSFEVGDLSAFGPDIEEAPYGEPPDIESNANNLCSEYGIPTTIIPR